MKIIRPENTPPPKKKEIIKTYGWESRQTHTDFIEADGRTIRMTESLMIDDSTFKTEAEKIMDEVIDENFIKVEIMFTKEQHEEWIKKGAEKWLKEELKNVQIKSKR